MEALTSGLSKDKVGSETVFVLSLHASCFILDVLESSWNLECNIFLYVLMWLCFCSSVCGT
jgi:hypothetical protein